MLFSDGIFWFFYSAVLLLLQLNRVSFRSIALQNLLLLFASYFFYAYWDWRFLGLILLVSMQTFLFGGLISKNRRFEKIYISVAVIINVTILGYFKYFNFFAREFTELLGIEHSFTLSHIILPVGISFYIFQSLTYVLDIYFKKLEPEQKLLNYLTFIAFFPQLVAGPIERASSLLPQFRILHRLTVDNIYTGIKVCIIGLFLKVVVADSLAPITDDIFTNYQSLNGGTLALGAVYFSIQIYGDFCGYSLIAIGVAKVMGFELMKNFNTPYFATSIQDFWRRWHISLSSFFRDYVYIPLGGNRASSELGVQRNILVTFFLSGIWHGANWTFVAWGTVHGLLLIIQHHFPKKIHKFFGWLVTMMLVLILWIMFRSASIGDFWHYTSRMVSHFSFPNAKLSGVVFIGFYIAVDLFLLKYNEQGSVWGKYQAVEALILSTMVMIVLGTIHDVNPNFVYFQF